MDKMEEWEVAELYSVLNYSDVNLWQIGRIVSYFCCLPYMKNKTPINEFLPLPFDEGESKNENKYEITNEEISYLKKMSSSISDKLKGEEK